MNSPFPACTGISQQSTAATFTTEQLSDDDQEGDDRYGAPYGTMRQYTTGSSDQYEPAGHYYRDDVCWCNSSSSTNQVPHHHFPVHKQNDIADHHQQPHQFYWNAYENDENLSRDPRLQYSSSSQQQQQSVIDINVFNR